jgi:hypothetical protein
MRNYKLPIKASQVIQNNPFFNSAITTESLSQHLRMVKSNDVCSVQPQQTCHRRVKTAHRVMRLQLDSSLA